MAIASALRQFLDAEHADFEVIEHAPTMSAMEIANVCNIPPGQFAKAVLIDIDDDDRLLAVLPGDHRIQLSDLRSALGQRARLADEHEVSDTFSDCVSGAVPPFGTLYGVDLIIDDSLQEEPEIYFEAGDHESLIHMNREEFSRLTRNARHGRFSEHWSEHWPRMS